MQQLLLILLLLLSAQAQTPRRDVKRSANKPTTRVGPAPRFDDWRVIGPGGGGTMIGPTISPQDPDVVLEHCDMTGAYVTTDGGRSWRMFNLRTVVSTFAFDPNSSSVIYAGNAALWRSEDSGKTWRMIFPDPAKDTREHTWNDHAEYVLTTNDPSYPASGKEIDIQAITVDPANSNQLYVVFGSSFATPQPSSLYFSGNRGRTFARLTAFGREKIYAVHIQSRGKSGKKVVYVIGESGVYIGKNGGWTHQAGPAEKIEFASVGSISRVNVPHFYVTTRSRWDGATLNGGVYTTSDGGQHWRPVGVNLTSALWKPGEDEAPQFQAISCAATNALIAYVGFRGLRLGDGPMNDFNGIAKTEDGGQTWTIVHKESSHASMNLDGSWIEQRAPDSSPNIWFDAPYSLGVAPRNPDICYATDLFRTYRTTDGGKTWAQVNSVRINEDRWSTRGLDVTTSYGVHFDPHNSRRMFISYTDIGLFRSEDAGSSWTGSTVGIPNTWRNTTYWVVFDPRVKNLLWGAFSATHDLPRPKMWRTRNPDTYEGGVAVSKDGGRHWEVSNTGMPQTAVTHILLDPRSPLASRTLYACGFGRGVYKSTDNGKTWALKNNGIEKQHPFAWRLTLAKNGTLYLVVARRSERGRIGDADDGALYKSVDGGDHWTKIELPLGTNGPMSLLLDPLDERRMYLAAWGVAQLGGDSGGGIFRSTDGGQSWNNIFNESQHIYDVTVDPERPNVLYACGFDAAAYRSSDGGDTWARIKGYNFKWGHRVILDPIDRSKIYITTFGGSVWQGPATGDPNAVEDIIVPRR